MGTTLVIGSTGKVGRTATQELLKAGKSVRAATPTPSKYRGTNGVQRIYFDYTDPRTFPPGPRWGRSTFSHGTATLRRSSGRQIYGSIHQSGVGGWPQTRAVEFGKYGI
jgi:nucleoside-diphosphate-sugar epimerase